MNKLETIKYFISNLDCKYNPNSDSLIVRFDDHYVIETPNDVITEWSVEEIEEWIELAKSNVNRYYIKGLAR